MTKFSQTFFCFKTSRIYPFTAKIRRVCWFIFTASTTKCIVGHKMSHFLPWPTKQMNFTKNRFLTVNLHLQLIAVLYDENNRNMLPNDVSNTDLTFQQGSPQPWWEQSPWSDWKQCSLNSGANKDSVMLGDFVPDHLSFLMKMSSPNSHCYHFYTLICWKSLTIMQTS